MLGVTSPMTSATRVHTLNIALGEVLGRLRRSWRPLLLALVCASHVGVEWRHSATFAESEAAEGHGTRDIGGTAATFRVSHNTRMTSWKDSRSFIVYIGSFSMRSTKWRRRRCITSQCISCRKETSTGVRP